MKIVIITCFESNEERLKLVYDACKTRNYDVKAYSSDFSHIRKQTRTQKPEHIDLIHVKPYKKNLSFARILSHMKFAKDVFSMVEKDVPDLIWLIAPANSLIKEAKAFKKEHPSIRIIIDIIDMWPESLPVRMNKNLLPFAMWKNIRARNIDCANAVVSECDMYQTILQKEYKGKINTIYLARDNEDIIIEPNADNSKLSLVYIGSINNIIDIDKIVRIIASCDQDVILHIIGEGENTDEFIEKARTVCEVVYHGAIRDEKKKSLIFNQCHAGINIYRSNLYIGFTTKCIDYFAHGLPIINTIKGDTWKMVNERDAGINLEENSVIKSEVLMRQRLNYKSIVELYNENFTREVFSRKCLDVIDEVSR